MWHGFSWKFHLTNRRQFGPNPHQIPWLFHVIACHKSAAVGSKSTPNSMTIPCHLCHLEHDMDFGQVQIMEFLWNLQRKWWDFHRIRSHFWPNCRQKDMRKSVSHFLQGIRRIYCLWKILTLDVRQNTVLWDFIDFSVSFIDTFIYDSSFIRR